MSLSLASLSWRDRIRLAETGGGRYAGWIIENPEGRRLAELDWDGQDDMFWDRYRVVRADTESAVDFADRALHREGGLLFRSRCLPSLVVSEVLTVPAANLPSHIIARSLYIKVRCNVLEQIWVAIKRCGVRLLRAIGVRR